MPCRARHCFTDAGGGTVPLPGVVQQLVAAACS
jgi:hypothetical protein